MSPTAHAAQGVLTGLLLYRLLEPVGLGGLVLVLGPVISWIGHWILDIPGHFEFIMVSSREKFQEALAQDPKNRIKEEGLGPLFPFFSSKGRERLAADPRTADLAHPEPLSIFREAQIAGILDVLVAGALAYWLSAQLTETHPAVWWFGISRVTWIGLVCAAGAIAPDLLLFRPLFKFGIRFTWFWKQDYFHHYIHTRVLPYEWRSAGVLVWLGTTFFLSWLVTQLA